MVMKPMPPMPLIHGSSAPIAMPVATAASIALPPLRRISAPTSAALQFCATTTPLPRTACLVTFHCLVSDSLIDNPHKLIYRHPDRSLAPRGEAEGPFLSAPTRQRSLDYATLRVAALGMKA